MEQTSQEPIGTSAFQVGEIEAMPAIHGGAVKLAGATLGVESFGLQVLDIPAGFDGYPEHDHAEDGQEEVYIALRGSATLVVEDERLALDPDRMVRVPPDSRRKVEPGPEGVRLLVIGCTAGRPYERPEGFRLGSDL